MNLIRLIVVGGIALAMYVYLPVLDIVELIFILAIGAAWLLLVVDFGMTSTGMIADLSYGFSERARSGLESARAAVKSHREDFAARVEAKLAATV